MTVASQCQVLIVDDEKNMRNLLLDILEDDGWQAVACASGEEALEVLQESSATIPAMIVDLSMPGMDGFEVIKRTLKMSPDTTIIVITAFGNVDTAVKAMQLGAADFVVKPFDNSRIRSAVRRSFESRDLLTRAEFCHPTFVGADRAPLPMIGSDESLQDVFTIIKRIADLKTSVLIQGESGTGKELVAQAVHYNGSRRDKPFVAVNCAALPETLLESEFFGHERGAFTGAHALQRGKFELADGGTLFLDEIGEMPLGLQAKFLRVLQDQRFRRVGGESEISVDVRIIAATNADLQESIRTKAFREDLYYRLNVIPLHLPPLRERRQDIPQLARYFNQRFSDRHKLEPLKLSDEIIAGIQEREWPGNIRELQNAVEKALVLRDARVLLESSSYTVTPSGSEIPKMTAAKPPVSEDHLLVDLGEEGEIRPLGDVAADAQRGAVIRAIRLCGGNKAEAAKRLGVSYKTLFNKIHELDITTSTKVE
ncbi:sigma-54 dependent transcriptional regulator [bacterium]|nr:sigma-54 dependent transcriptional regulator [bacterium]